MQSVQHCVNGDCVRMGPRPRPILPVEVTMLNFSGDFHGHDHSND